MADLVSSAQSGWFGIAETCPQDYRNLFLNQARAHPSEFDGHDDAFDATAYFDDPALKPYIPMASIVQRRKNSDAWWKDEDDQDRPYISRYFNR
jgi:hypothetical protein